MTRDSKPQDAAEIASPIVILGSADQIRDFICGPQQHNEHTKGWKWHRYIQDDAARWANVKAEMQAMHAERRARLAAHEQFAEAAE